MDAAGQFLMDLENLSDETVLPVGGTSASVLKHEAVLEDPLACRVQRWDEFCTPTTKITLPAPKA